MMVMAVVMMRRSGKRRSRKENSEGENENLFHGLILAITRAYVCLIQYGAVYRRLDQRFPLA
jgi:hypothetical protein